MLPDVWTEHEARDLAEQFDQHYPSKKAKQERIKAVLNDSALKTPLEGRDLLAVLATLAGHPDVGQKIGVGVTAVEVRPALHGTRGFYITRADGSGTDFSYLKCLSRPTTRQEVHAACRNALKPEMACIKEQYLKADPTCQVTGMPITAENSHLHHAPPMFDVIADRFAEHMGGFDVLAGRMVKGDNVYGAQLAAADEEAWLVWHAERAELQLIHKSANLHIEAARRAIRKAG